MVFEPKINIKSIDNINIIILGRIEASFNLSFLIEKEFNELNDDILSKVDVPISLILTKGKKII
jgi:hypothetical protein